MQLVAARIRGVCPYGCDYNECAISLINDICNANEKHPVQDQVLCRALCQVGIHRQFGHASVSGDEVLLLMDVPHLKGLP